MTSTVKEVVGRAGRTIPHRDWTDRLAMRMLLVFTGGMLVLALLGAWVWRHSMNPDGISYLDLADDVRRMGVVGALNAYWSPAYSWVLALALSIGKPSSYWEFGFAHLVNVVIFLAALAMFWFFWGELARQRTKAINAPTTARSDPFPRPAWWLFGMALFCQATLEHIPLNLVTPDMMVAASVFACAGLLLRVIRGASWVQYAALGVTLGVGSLCKGAMLPLSLVFLGCAAFYGPSRRKHWFAMLIALAMFGTIILPYAGALSLLKERITFGDVGRLNYSVFVNGATYFPFWQGEQPGLGHPEHPATVLMEEPKVYAFHGPVAGSFPGWKDPSYWYEGIATQLDLAAQARAIRRSMGAYLDMLLRNSGYFLSVIVLFFILSANSQESKPPLKRQWPLFVVSGAAFAMYSLVLVEPRYVAAFWAIGLGASLSSLSIEEGVIGRKTLNLTACFVAALSLVLTAEADLPQRLRNVMEQPDGSSHPQWQIAKALGDLGLKEGDVVGFIGDPFYAYWARLARVQLRVSAPGDGTAVLWSRSEGEQERILRTFEKAGATAVIVSGAPEGKRDSEWRRLGATDYYARFLNGGT